jgi:Yip1-like protein
VATLSSDLPAEQPETLGDDLAGMASFFIDPQGAARRVHTKWFWVGPLAVYSIVGIAAGILIMPIVQHVMEIAPLPEGASPEQFQKGMAIGLTVQKVFVYLAPITAGVMFAIQAVILLAMSSITGVGAKFRQLFNLAAGCGLISVLASIATIVILKAKGEISTMAELRPALGFDIFLPDSANKYAVAFLGYFSVFEVWWIVMIVLILAAAFRISKGKAFIVVSPLVLLSLIWRVGAAAFQR